MGLARKLLIFLVLTAAIILLGRLAGKLIPISIIPSPRSDAPPAGDSLRDSTNALPDVEADTTGGRWHEKLFDPLEQAHGLSAKSLKKKTGYYELTFPKGKPIHEYALDIEKTCRARGVTVVAGAELRPSNRSVEYLLESNGQRIKLRASLGVAVMAGSAKLAIVFTGLDSLTETRAAELESAPWEKTLVVDPYAMNPALRKLRFTESRNEILIELPMEPASYPYLDPGKHALFIHHGKDDVERILAEARDSLPKAAGFASRYGDRAIENQPLLEKLFQFTAARGLLFMDLTGSQRSLARQTAMAQGARSRTVAVYKDSVNLEEELARKSALAQKTGEAVFVLRYTPTAFRNLSLALEAHTGLFNEVGLELATVSSLAVPDSTAGREAPETVKPAAPPATPAAPAKTAPAKAKPASTALATNKAKPGAVKSASPGKPGAKPAVSKPAASSKPAAGTKAATPAKDKPASSTKAKPAGAKHAPKPAAKKTTGAAK